MELVQTLLTEQLPHRIEFWWKYPVPTWGPFSKEQLTQMVIQVAMAVRFSPANVGNLWIVFGEHIRLIFPANQTT